MKRLKKLSSLLTTIAVGWTILAAGQSLAEVDFNEKIQELAEKLTSSTAGKIIEADGEIVYINLGEKDSIYRGAQFEVVELGDVIMEGGKAYYKEKPVGIVEVTRVRSKDLSIAKVIYEIKPITKGCKVYQVTSFSPARLTSTTSASQGSTEVIAITGVDLKSVFRRLEAAGLKPGSYSETELSTLSEAIKRFQKLGHMEASGQLDMATWDKMKRLYDPNSSTSDLVSEIPPALTVRQQSFPQPQLTFSPPKKVNNIALMEFNHGGSFNSLTRNIYESLAVSLIQKGYQIVERSKLDQVLKEQKLGYSGLIDTSTAQKLGKLMGGEIVLVGSLSEMGNKIAVRARMVDVEKGMAVTAAEIMLDKTPDILAALQSGIRRDTTVPPGIGGKQVTPPRSGKPIQTQEVDGFTVTLQKCLKSGSSVNCDLILTNNKKDRRTAIDARDSRIIDNSGNVYQGSDGNIANAGVYQGITMVKGILVKASISFSDIDPSAKSIALLEIDFDGNWGSTVQFRDVQFTAQ